MVFRIGKIIGGILLVAFPFVDYGVNRAITWRACGLKPSPGGEVLVVSATGRRWDMRPDVEFGTPKGSNRKAHVSFLDVEVPYGKRQVRLVLGSREDIVYRVTGDVYRIDEVRSFQGTGRAAVVGIPERKVSFEDKPECLDLMRSDGQDPMTTVLAFDWTGKAPMDDECTGRRCPPARPTWPRKVRLPGIVEVDPAETLASSPVAKAGLIPGRAGLAQLLGRGLLRPPMPGEAESALRAVSDKYAGRFRDGWRPGFGIDFVMTGPTPLPPDASEPETATVLVPSGIAAHDTGGQCVVAMGPLAPPEPGHLVRRSRPRLPPPYVMGWGLCLGGDSSDAFREADALRHQGAPRCRAVEPAPDALVLAAMDLRAGPAYPKAEEARTVDLRISGDRPVVLVGLAKGHRLWRIHESYPGQVEAFVMAGPVFDREPIQVEGLRPEQVVVDELRLDSAFQGGQAVGEKPWRHARFIDECIEPGAGSDVMPMRNRFGLEDWLPMNVKAWTGRDYDGLTRVTSDAETLVEAR